MCGLKAVFFSRAFDDTSRYPRALCPACNGAVRCQFGAVITTFITSMLYYIYVVYSHPHKNVSTFSF